MNKYMNEKITTKHRPRRAYALLGSLLMLLVLTVAQLGCRNSDLPVASQSTAQLQNDAPPTTSTVAKNATNEGTATDDHQQGSDHEHVDGAHGGMIVEIGSDSYHAEFVVESNGTMRMFMLGKDETRIQEVESQTIKAFVKAANTQESKPLELVATPQEGDAEGQTSQFVGQLPEELVGQAIEVTIPNLRIKDERFRLAFKTEVFAAASEMPPAASDKEAAELYLTPGGKYTQADIDANGKVTASQKYSGAMSAHNMNPKQGDKICPVTQTKANPKFVWVIDGKNYEFCCPPCIDEFVRMAKEQPDEIKDPSEYIKQ
jgi:hypothetical protein